MSRPISERSGDKELEFDREDVVVPAGLFGKLVVGDGKGPLLHLRQAGNEEDRNVDEACEPRGCQSRVTTQQVPGVVGYERGIEPEVMNALGNLPDLFLWVGVSVLRVGLKPRRRTTSKRYRDILGSYECGALLNTAVPHGINNPFG